MTPEEREEAVTTAMLLHIEPDGDGFVHVHQNDVWNAVATAHDAATLVERERCAKIDFTDIVWGVLKEHKKSKRLALHDLHVMHMRIAAAIREEPTDE